MATLDYAFLADYARVESNGTLTSVGASWTFLEVDSLPTRRRLAIAGRIRSSLGSDPVQLTVEIEGPEGTFKLTGQGTLEVAENARPYAGDKVGHLFAIDIDVAIPVAGLYVVELTLDGEHVRTLKFDVVGPSLP